MSLRPPPAGAPAPAGETPGIPAVGAPSRRASATAPLWSVLLIRSASSAGGVVIGLYLAYLHSLGQQVTSVTVGLVAAVFYLTELTLTPVLGALSDRYGRKRFLVLGPLVGAVAVFLPPLALALPLLIGMRLLEGVSSSSSTPATLGYLAAATSGSEQSVRRGRVIGLFELAAAGGIAAGAALGPLLWKFLSIYSFWALSVTYLLAAVAVLWVREPIAVRRVRAATLAEYWRLVAQRRLALFIPAWIAINAIVGVWLTSQLAFVLVRTRRPLHFAGQQVVSSIDESQLSVILVVYVLWFALCLFGWSFCIGRLPKVPVMLLAVIGTLLACIALYGINHRAPGTPIEVWLPLLGLAVLIESAFTPTAVAYLADVAERFAADRGLLMGLYSVFLGLGQLLGNSLGGVFAQAWGFDGLVYLTALLAATALGCMSVLLATERGRAHRAPA
jgi:MFS family permease